MPNTSLPAWPRYFIDSGAAHRKTGPDSHEIASGLHLEPIVAEELLALYRPLAAYGAAAVQAQGGAPYLIGVNGAQGTGKSTAAHILQCILQQAYGLRVCSLSIDDLYLSREARRVLSERVHPLLATRGVPGTHDLSLALKVFEQLRSADATTTTAIPRFNKAIDDQLPQDQWEKYQGRPDVIIFEGWCVGARAQRSSDLEQPVNQLEAQEDAEGGWRRYVNECLRDYQSLFNQLDLLVMLKAPSFDQVFEWRQLQEDKLRLSLSAEQLAHSKVMTPAQIERFIAHYERLTRWMLQEMPGRCDVLLSLGQDHKIATIKCQNHATGA